MSEDIAYYKKEERPFTAFRFLIEVDGEKDPVGAFTNFSGIKASTQIAKARTGNDIRGVKDNFPGITEYQHITLSKGVIGNTKFLDWLFHTTLPGAFTGPQGDLTVLAVLKEEDEKNKKDEKDEKKPEKDEGGTPIRKVYRNIRVVALTDTMERGITWTLLNAIPVGYELQPMDANQSVVLSEQIEFAITGVIRVVNAEEKDSIVSYDAKLPGKKITSNTFTYGARLPEKKFTFSY